MQTLVREYYDDKYRTPGYVGLNPDPLHYHRVIIRHVLDMPDVDRILDVGCATGYMASIIKRERDVEVVGIDVSPHALDQAADVVDETVCGNIENLEIPWPDNHFDVIICGDVLEHLFEPTDTLSRLRSLLPAEGRLLASVPNVAYWKLRLHHLAGRWKYTGRGIMEWGHIRFFTQSSLQSLLRTSGYEVMGLRGWFPLFWKLKNSREGWALVVRHFLTSLMPRGLAHSFVVAARPDTISD
jgi:2-polyprenyl-3-methyl-5-hydroxy-6-metoxy-1,4-benzoquinol methylase